MTLISYPRSATGKRRALVRLEGGVWLRHAYARDRLEVLEAPGATPWSRISL